MAALKRDYKKRLEGVKEGYREGFLEEGTGWEEVEDGGIGEGFFSI